MLLKALAVKCGPHALQVVARGVDGAGADQVLEGLGHAAAQGCCDSRRSSLLSRSGESRPLALAWPIGAVYAGVWLGLLAATRFSSLAGMCAAVSAPLTALAIGRTELVPVLAALAVLVIVLHRANIARLRAGTEPKVGSKA